MPNPPKTLSLAEYGIKVFRKECGYEKTENEIGRPSETESHLGVPVYSSVYYRIFGIYGKTAVSVPVHEL